MYKRQISFRHEYILAGAQFDYQLTVSLLHGMNPRLTGIYLYIDVYKRQLPVPWTYW